MSTSSISLRPTLPQRVDFLARLRAARHAVERDRHVQLVAGAQQLEQRGGQAAHGTHFLPVAAGGARRAVEAPEELEGAVDEEEWRASAG